MGEADVNNIENILAAFGNLSIYEQARRKTNAFQERLPPGVVDHVPN